MKISNDVMAGSAIYAKHLLPFYDFFVLGFSNTLIWKCPSSNMLALYNKYVSGNHLDVGVGTGHFLDKCIFPCDRPDITLLDLNPNSLQATSKRINRYCPQIQQYNILDPLQINKTFDSIGMNYLLHCLPGTMLDKEYVFQNLKPLLNEGGTLFGATILGKGVTHTWSSKLFIAFYNSRRIFTNKDDTYTSLESILARNFNSFSLKTIGCVALFAATA